MKKCTASLCLLIVMSVLSHEKKLLALENGKKSKFFFPFYSFIRNFAKTFTCYGL